VEAHEWLVIWMYPALALVKLVVKAFARLTFAFYQIFLDEED